MKKLKLMALAMVAISSVMLKADIESDITNLDAAAVVRLARNDDVTDQAFNCALNGSRFARFSDARGSIRDGQKQFAAYLKGQRITRSKDPVANEIYAAVIVPKSPRAPRRGRR